jgi:hypothetical protein
MPTITPHASTRFLGSSEIETATKDHGKAGSIKSPLTSKFPLSTTARMVAGGISAAAIDLRLPSFFLHDQAWTVSLARTFSLSFSQTSLTVSGRTVTVTHSLTHSLEVCME